MIELRVLKEQYKIDDVDGYEVQCYETWNLEGNARIEYLKFPQLGWFPVLLQITG